MAGFTWQDGERTIRFGRGAVDSAPELLRDGYALLTTERAQASAPQIAERAASVHLVGPGLVDELAAALLDAVTAPLVVGLGGGRVIDTAKAIAAAAGTRAAAIPNTLSAAEMTKIHRLPKGREDGAERVRPAIVINDPDLSASQPDDHLAASAANALAHAVEAPATTLASPVPTLAAREAQRLIDTAYLVDDEPVGLGPREQLALAALLAGYAIDAAWYGLSHVCSQTLVRVGGAAHGPANAAVLPHTIAALESRRPGRVDPDGSLRQLARRLAVRAGAARIRDLGVPEERLDACADAAARRPELDLTPPRADRDELREIYAAAW
jgi:alcohol dehydrogenase class IV